MRPTITIILTTYNWPEALRLSLLSLEAQTNKNFEVVIADDGSRYITRELIDEHRKILTFNIFHVWQEDKGFRKSKILNQAIQRACGDYLIFLDGDCIVQPDFVDQHIKLAEVGVLVTGGRILLGAKLTAQLCESKSWVFSNWVRKSFLYRLTRQMNKLLPLFIKLPDFKARIYKDFKWSRIKGCNMAAWRQDIMKINGFDESLEGWGHEDADFVFRLHSNGVKRKSGSWATEVLHLWHKTASKAQAEKNAEIVRIKILAKSPTRDTTLTNSESRFLTS
jgi:glycosyltransferase involved in cell wall biosynthesis